MIVVVMVVVVVRKELVDANQMLRDFWIARTTRPHRICYSAKCLRAKEFIRWTTVTLIWYRMQFFFMRHTIKIEKDKSTHSQSLFARVQFFFLSTLSLVHSRTRSHPRWKYEFMAKVNFESVDDDDTKRNQVEKKYPSLDFYEVE